jgi:hypothetical protein
VVLAHRYQHLHHAPVEQAEIAGVGGDVYRGEAVDQAIEDRGGEQL